MSFSGVCHVCEAAEGRNTCEQCGALACDEHYDPELGACSQCAASLGGWDDIDEGRGSGMQM